MAKYSEGSVRNIGDDRWQARFCFYDKDAFDRDVRKYCSRNFRATSRKAALKEKRRIRDELERTAALENIFVSRKEEAPDLCDFLGQNVDYMESSRLIAPSTALKYRTEVKVIRRYLGNPPISKVTTKTVKAMDAQMIKDGYVSETVARIHNSLKRHLADAVELGYIPKSPFTRSARPPRVEHKEKNALDDATRKRLLSLLEYMGDTRFTLAVRLGLGARLRNEEVVGLHWEDVDLDRVYLHIRRALASVGGKSLEKGPKTQAGRRDIPIDKDLARRLRDWAVSEFGASGTARLLGLNVLGDKDGGHYPHASLIHKFSAFAKDCGLVGTTGKLATFYSLRHTYATSMLRAGVDPKTVASLMGHSSVATTLNVYASTDPAAKAAAGKVVERLMAQRTGMGIL
jgi:integrase